MTGARAPRCRRRRRSFCWRGRQRATAIWLSLLAVAAEGAALPAMALATPQPIGVIAPAGSRLAGELKRELGAANLASVSMVASDREWPAEMIDLVSIPYLQGVVVGSNDERMIVFSRTVTSGRVEVRFELRFDPNDRPARRRACLAVVEGLRALNETTPLPPPAGEAVAGTSAPAALGGARAATAVALARASAPATGPAPVPATGDRDRAVGRRRRRARRPVCSAARTVVTRRGDDARPGSRAGRADGALAIHVVHPGQRARRLPRAGDVAAHGDGARSGRDRRADLDLRRGRGAAVRLRAGTGARASVRRDRGRQPAPADRHLGQHRDRQVARALRAQRQPASAERHPRRSHRRAFSFSSSWRRRATGCCRPRDRRPTATASRTRSRSTRRWARCSNTEQTSGASRHLRGDPKGVADDDHQALGVARAGWCARAGCERRARGAVRAGPAPARCRGYGLAFGRSWGNHLIT